MAQNQRRLMRETGMALAVLALYLLTLLLPLHQASGLQRDLNAIGYSTLSAWSLCGDMSETGDGEPLPAALTCPAMSIAKQSLVPVLPPALHIAAATRSDTPHPEADFGASGPSLPPHIGQSRAPPVTA